MRSAILLLLLSLLLVVGCMPLHPEGEPAAYYQRYGLAAPASPARFHTCNRSGCRSLSQVGLDAAQWQRVRQSFTPPAPTAEAERAQLAEAIGVLEMLVGAQNGTAADQACNNLREPVVGYQLDCVAEAANTTIFLHLLQQAQLLRHHRLNHPAKRAVLGLLRTHRSAVIRQIDSGAQFAVDSWFAANGEQPLVLPLKRWAEKDPASLCR